jgi:hypothetical protein
VEIRSSDAAPLDHRKRSRFSDIAMQRPSQKSLKQSRAQKNSSQTVLSDTAAHRALLSGSGCATISRPAYFTRPSTPLEPSK